MSDVKVVTDTLPLETLKSEISSYLHIARDAMDSVLGKLHGVESEWNDEDHAKLVEVAAAMKENLSVVEATLEGIRQRAEKKLEAIDALRQIKI